MPFDKSAVAISGAKRVLSIEDVNSALPFAFWPILHYRDRNELDLRDLSEYVLSKVLFR